MNYGEEIAYWYLRFNGFFPLTDFVLHRGSETDYPSDCDLLAIRHPFVKEEVGGQPDDWDERLTNHLDFENKIIGMICEVKTGEVGNILPAHNINRAVDRLGLFQDASRAKTHLVHSSIYDCPDSNFQLCKLLVADRRTPLNDSTLFVSLSSALEFLKARIRKYQRRKYGERLFFNSILLQQLIWQVNNERL